MNKVLVISYFFAPLSGPGVQRSLNFVKNLPSSNWQPVVLSVKDISYVSRDESLLSELDNIEIHRTESLDPMRLLYIYEKIRKVGTENSLYKRSNRSRRRILRDLLPIDSKLGWLPIAQKAGEKLCRTHDIQAIYVSMSPYSSGILAYNLSRKTGIPYILDYRDLWKGKPDMSYLSKWHERISTKWEKRIISSASAIIQVTERSKMRFMELYPEIPEEKIEVIFNGYDESKLKDVNHDRQKARKIKFLYAGHFYGQRSPQHFLEAVRELESAGELDKRLEIEFVGNYEGDTEELFKGIERVKRTQYLPYKEYFEKIGSSDALLLFISDKDSDLVLTQKLFDYLAVRKPILAIVPSEGEAAELIRRYRAGLIADSGNVIEIKQQILQMQKILREDKERDYFDIEKNDYSLFERKNQTKQLAAILNRVKYE